MERRKFLANLICIGVGASIAPKVFSELKSLEPPVDPGIFQYPLTYKECYKTPDFISGCVIGLKDNEVTILPYSNLDEFPVLKKGDKLLIFSNSFYAKSTDVPYSHKEEDYDRLMININERVPKVGAGNGITFLINKANLSKTKLKLWDMVLFPIK